MAKINITQFFFLIGSLLSMSCSRVDYKKDKYNILINPYNSLVSVGPDPGGKWIFNPFKFKNGTNDWKNYVDAGNDVLKISVKGVNLDRIASYGVSMNKGVNYNLYFSSCVNHTARVLTLAGVPALAFILLFFIRKCYCVHLV